MADANTGPYAGATITLKCKATSRDENHPDFKALVDALTGSGIKASCSEKSSISPVRVTWDFTNDRDIAAMAFVLRQLPTTSYKRVEQQQYLDQAVETKSACLHQFLMTKKSANNHTIIAQMLDQFDPYSNPKQRGIAIPTIETTLPDIKPLSTLPSRPPAPVTANSIRCPL